ncbi:helix-turn-helix domain-containing protein [uncultured Sphingobacterium sp.]|uniref:helix-turn-helix domain-containing protein n=1 Tax=uncultured Sphingobacterium sp. TaxID=182688 RepID=UPI0034515006
MKNEVKKHFEWLKLYESVCNAGVVCLRCCITRPTLRKWLKRFKESGIDGLSELCRRPHKIHH